MNEKALSTKPTRLQALLACATIMAGIVLNLAGIDLVLPSVPAMPEIFGTTVAMSQQVLSAFVAGTTLGLLVFGSLAEHFGRRRLFITSLVTYGLLSFACTFSTDIWHLIILRFLQGAAATGAAVLAPGLIRSLFSEHGAMRAIGAMGSIESLVPGLAPLAGAWLYKGYGWEASFALTAILLGIVCLLVVIRPTLIPSIGVKTHTGKGSYMKLLKNSAYMRYAQGHALTVGGLLTFVFSAPAIIVQTMGGTIDNFITMQMVGVATFIISANMASGLAKRFGTETMIMVGTIVCVFSTFILLAYAIWGANDPTHLPALFWVLNTGVGLRAGPGFVMALKAANGDDDRASALIILSITGFAAIATAVVAPFIQVGLITLTLTTCLIVLAALVLMLVIPPIKDATEAQE